MRTILILGGGTAGWLTAALLARHFESGLTGPTRITVIESPDIAAIGVGEGAFPTLRATLRHLGVDEADFMRRTSATFKQGIRFNNWVRTPRIGESEHFFHPFEAPWFEDGAALACWLRMAPDARPPFAQAMTFQKRVAEAGRGPKRPHEGAFTGPLNYAYHMDSIRLAEVLAQRARELGVQHVEDAIETVALDADGGIASVTTSRHGAHKADLYIDCTGFRAELIDKALKAPFHAVRDILFADRAVVGRAPYPRPDAPLESYTLANAHEAGWSWDIGLGHARGVGYVYSSAHTDDDRAQRVLHDHLGAEIDTRVIRFEPGWRETPWVKNCVAVGLSGGFVEPLEATGIVLIELAASMIAELLPAAGPVSAPAERFNALMRERYENITSFLKLHYVLSQRDEPFWRDNRDPDSIPERLRDLLAQWRHRPPSRFDFRLDAETFAWFNYQYILYGMGFQTRIDGAATSSGAEAQRMFNRIRQYGERATLDLPPHRALIEQIYAHGFREPA